MNYLNRTAKLAFYNARKHNGDVSRIVEETGMSSTHTRRMLAGERRINFETADSAYQISRNRTKNSQLYYTSIN